MKIGVNGRFLTIPFTGVEQYTKNLLLNLAQLDPKVQYYLVVNKPLASELRNIFPSNVIVKHIKEKPLAFKNAKKTWWEQIQVPEYFQKEGVDIAFFPYVSSPWTKDWYNSDIKTVLTVHDCIPWIDKQNEQGILSKMYNTQSQKSVKNADVILTVSQESKQDVIHVCNAPDYKILVAYNDVATEYKTVRTQDSINKVLKHLQLTRNKYFLYVGGYNSQKNVQHLINEFSLLESDVKLVLAGGKILNKKLSSSLQFNKKTNIIKTGFLDIESLSALYQGATAFISLSKLEGFNIPILEAANSGIPLILSDIPVHREVAADKALYVDLKTPGSAVEKMQYILDPEVRTKMSQLAKVLPQKYSWNENAKIVYNVFTQLYKHQ